MTKIAIFSTCSLLVKLVLCILLLSAFVVSETVHGLVSKDNEIVAYPPPKKCGETLKILVGGELIEEDAELYFDDSGFNYLGENPEDFKEKDDEVKALSVESSTSKAKEVLGRAGWSILHNLSAHYPVSATEDYKKDLKEFLDLFLTKIYPCYACLQHMKDIYLLNPPTVNSETEFVDWVCLIHNKVNEDLGKPQFNCTNALAFWRGNDTSLVGGSLEKKEDYRRSVWTFLHIMAVKCIVPEHAPFLRRFLDLFFTKINIDVELNKEYLIKGPPQLTNSDEFIIWACDFHNGINKKLGKEIFNCKKSRGQWTDHSKCDSSCDLTPKF